ncbi:hypothetical protein V2J09_004439, partial [Rumex salicifolius]
DKGNGRLSTDSIEFSNWINDLSLIDLGFKENIYTWKRGRTSNTYIAKRLNRVLCYAQARIRWQEAEVAHLPYISSNHTPLHLRMSPCRKGCLAIPPRVQGAPKCILVYEPFYSGGARSS